MNRQAHVVVTVDASRALDQIERAIEAVEREVSAGRIGDTLRYPAVPGVEGERGAHMPSFVAGVLAAVGCLLIGAALAMLT